MGFDKCIIPYFQHDFACFSAKSIPHPLDCVGGGPVLLGDHLVGDGEGVVALVDERLHLDHVLLQVTPLLEGVTDRERAAELIRENLKGLEACIGEFMEDNGRTETVQIQFTEEMYPTRSYDAFSLPAGEYLSMRVVLGEGKGQNWWCVLFPSVCSRFALQDTESLYREAGFTPEQYRLITHTEKVQYQVRFRLLEILETLFSDG